MLERLKEIVLDLAARLDLQPTYGWAVVTSLTPLQIRYDAQAEPIAGTPDTLVSGLAVSDRVWCMRIFRRDLILGRAKGQKLTAASGIVKVPVSGIVATATVTFPIGIFTEPPLLMLTKQNGVAAKHVPYVSGVSSTSANIGIYSGDNSSASGEVLLGWRATPLGE